MTTVGAAPGVTTRAGAAGEPPQKRGRRWLGENPLGLLFSAPYLIFVLVVFAYPIVFAVWMSFQDYFFAAPGAVVDRPSQRVASEVLRAHRRMWSEING